MSYPWESINTLSLDVLNSINFSGNPGNDGESIYKDLGYPVWKKTTGVISRFIDNTNMTQDLNTSPVPISFNSEDYNNANISYGVDNFVFNDSGLYYLDFEGLLSNAAAQTMISFTINGNFIYGNLSTITYNGTPVPYQLSTTIYCNSGDVLRVMGEKYDNGPNYLMTNPIYGTPITQLIIQRLTF